MKGKTLAEIKIGDSASTALTITETHVVSFAGIIGDFNPVHLDDVAAKNSMFKGRISHGMLVGSLFSSILGMQLPGVGTIYLGQELKFLKPVYLNDTITATVTVKEIIAEKNRVILDTVAVNQNGESVVVGTATVMPPRE